MSCNYYRGKCLFLNGKEDGCKGCPIKKAYNKGVRDTKKDYERPQGVWVAVDSYSAFGGSEETWMAHGNPTAYYYCSNCKQDAHANDLGEDILSKFCPECGAIMLNPNKEK